MLQSTKKTNQTRNKYAQVTVVSSSSHETQQDSIFTMKILSSEYSHTIFPFFRTC